MSLRGDGTGFINWHFFFCRHYFIEDWFDTKVKSRLTLFVFFSEKINTTENRILELEEKVAELEAKANQGNINMKKNYLAKFVQAIV